MSVIYAVSAVSAFLLAATLGTTVVSLSATSSSSPAPAIIELEREVSVAQAIYRLEEIKSLSDSGELQIDRQMILTEIKNIREQLAIQFHGVDMETKMPWLDVDQELEDTEKSLDSGTITALEALDKIIITLAILN